KTDYLYYALAASHGQAGDADLCIRALQKAIQLNSQSRFHARNDPDFEPMRNNKEFSAVLEPPGTE
ncbi:MAG: hypothetical protein HYX74_06940, partial [Acidobacteria bacterium]|nr:hypothetical protein [Acidobacteriota bacterium]